MDERADLWNLQAEELAARDLTDLLGRLPASHEVISPKATAVPSVTGSCSVEDMARLASRELCGDWISGRPNWLKLTLDGPGPIMPPAEFQTALCSPYVRQEVFGPDRRMLVPSASDLPRILEAGGTVHVQNVEQFSPAVAALCDTISRECGFPPVRANLYVARNGAVPAVPPHSDASGLAAIQLLGSKRWALWPARSGPPPVWHQTDANGLNQTDTDPDVAELAAGDVLLLGRGCPHTAFPVGDGICAHLTLMIFPPTRLDAAAYRLQRTAAKDGIGQYVFGDRPLEDGADSISRSLTSKWTSGERRDFLLSRRWATASEWPDVALIFSSDAELTQARLRRNNIPAVLSGSTLVTRATTAAIEDDSRSLCVAWLERGWSGFACEDQLVEPRVALELARTMLAAAVIERTLDSE